MLARARQWARHIKRDVLVVYFAARHPATPLAVRLLALAIAAYALSPIDLIPDFVPIFGYLDDLLIVPLGIALVMRLLPPAVLEASRARAAAVLQRPRSWMAGLCIVVFWIGLFGLFAIWLARYLA